MILVTGATGFVGRALCASVIERYPIRIAVRNTLHEGLPEGVDVVRRMLSAGEDWSESLIGVSTVVHCAARVHVMNERSSDSLAEFRRVNVDGTLRLAGQAAAAGVKRFVFISSIKVNGDQTDAERPFTADQEPKPVDPYGISKMEAEHGLRGMALETGMEVVIIRPPLVYGPGVKGNFLSIMRCLWRGYPLPLGAVTGNKRSLVSLDNLIDLIMTCIDHPAAANQIFLVSDGEDVSTATLLRRLGQALGRAPRLVPVPVALLNVGSLLLGRPDLAQRLCGSLQVDIGKTGGLLGWVPPLGLDEGLRRTAAHWIKSQSALRG
jgi:nucleoside-diphosphate-sugar epimerase